MANFGEFHFLGIFCVLGTMCARGNDSEITASQISHTGGRKPENNSLSYNGYIYENIHNDSWSTVDHRVDSIYGLAALQLDNSTHLS